MNKLILWYNSLTHTRAHNSIVKENYCRYGFKIGERSGGRPSGWRTNNGETMTRRRSLRGKTLPMRRICQTMMRSMWMTCLRRTTIKLSVMKLTLRRKPKFHQSHSSEFSQWSLLLSHAGTYGEDNFDRFKSQLQFLGTNLQEAVQIFLPRLLHFMGLWFRLLLEGETSSDFNYI